MVAEPIHDHVPHRRERPDHQPFGQRYEQLVGDQVTRAEIGRFEVPRVGGGLAVLIDPAPEFLPDGPCVGTRLPCAPWHGLAHVDRRGCPGDRLVQLVRAVVVEHVDAGAEKLGDLAELLKLGVQQSSLNASGQLGFLKGVIGSGRRQRTTL